MIIISHLLFGAAIGSAIKNPILAIILAFLGHYLLDFLPHIEYSIANIKKRQWKQSTSEFLSIVIDFCLGLIFVIMFSSNSLIIYICAILAITPDILSILEALLPLKVLKQHGLMHRGKIHYFRNKKISNFWRISSQVLIVILSIYILKTFR